MRIIMILIIFAVTPITFATAKTPSDFIVSALAVGLLTVALVMTILAIEKDRSASK